MCVVMLRFESIASPSLLTLLEEAVLQVRGAEETTTGG